MSELSKNRLLRARTPVLVGFIALFVLLGGLGYWSVEARIAGAVIAPGTVQVEGRRQVVEHPDGGVVTEILARNGDVVEAGDVVLRLDSARLVSELAIVEGQLLELLVRKARLAAERDDRSDLVVDFGVAAPDLPAPASSVVQGERNLFAARRAGLKEETAQIDEQILQIENRIVGIGGQTTSLETQIDFVSSDLANAKKLRGQGLAVVSDVSNLERELADLQGQRARLEAETAELRGQIASARIQKVRLSTSRLEEVISELRDVEFREVELRERRLDLKDRIDRLAIRSPHNGIVFGSVIDAPLSVVRPAEPVMYVVPQDQPIIVEARVDPINVDQLFAGQAARLRLTALDQRTTPEIEGLLRLISADAVFDQATGTSYYAAEILPNPDGLASIGGQTIIPGMPVEVFIQTDVRRPIDYLTQPLTDYIARAFRE